MNNILLVCTSVTDFTKKYAEWIEEEISCDSVTFQHFKNMNFNQYSIIVYGAGVHAGKVRNLSKFKKIVKSKSNIKVHIFATGGAPLTEKIYRELQASNFTEEEVKRYPFYYFQSGLNYEKMPFVDRLMLKGYNVFLKLKKKKTRTETETKNTITQSYDNSKREYILPLIEALIKKEEN